jgi:spore germination protein
MMSNRTPTASPDRLKRLRWPRLPRRSSELALVGSRDKGTRRRRPPGIAKIFYLLIVLAPLVLLVVYLVRPIGSPPSRAVVGSLPYWNIQNGASVVLQNQQDFSEVSPWLYGLDGQGQITPMYEQNSAGQIDATLGRLRAAGLPVVPSLANVSGGRFSYQPMADILQDPARRAAHEASIVDLVTSRDYAGIDIDYEDLRGSDRQAFTAFVTELSNALHAKGKTLAVALFAKTTDAGYDQRNVAQDYAALGRAADQVRIMAYDFHWPTSPPGPIAPIGWVRDVLSYATTQIPPHKVILGIPMNGYDWVDGVGTPLTWIRALQLSRQYNVPPRYDNISQTPSFSYTDEQGRAHQVWFESAASTKAKLEVANGAIIGGVYFWMFGYEDGDTWSNLNSAYPINPGNAG